jgi:hypothetical protein
METIVIRIRRTDWIKIRKIFKSYEGETAQAYFFRLRSFIETRYGK